MPASVLPTAISLIPRRRPLLLAIAARMVLFLCALFIVDNLVDLASYPLLLVLSGWTGIGLAAILTSSRFTTRGQITLALVSFLFVELLL